VIVIDTSSLQRYLAGFLGRDTKAVAEAIARHDAYLPPLIAQICLDYGAPLVTYDGDFENFVDLGLKLL